MAVEDQKYNDILKAIQAFMATGRSAFVRVSLINLAYSILRHYGYDVVEATKSSIQD